MCLHMCKFTAYYDGCIGFHDSLAEWSKALAQGASPQGRGFEPHSCHFHDLLLLAVDSALSPHMACAICRVIAGHCSIASTCATAVDALSTTPRPRAAAQSFATRDTPTDT